MIHLAARQFHDHPQILVGPEDFVDGGDFRMIQRRAVASAEALSLAVGHSGLSTLTATSRSSVSSTAL
jgi:hypothetical protein